MVSATTGLLAIFGIITVVAVGTMLAGKKLSKSPRFKEYHNAETWEYTDYKGRKKTITVHRDARRA